MQTDNGGCWASDNNGCRRPRLFRRWHHSRTCATNCTNSNEIFSFHPAAGRISILMGDASVRYLSKSTKIGIVGRMITRNGGEVISATDF